MLLRHLIDPYFIIHVRGKDDDSFILDECPHPLKLSDWRSASCHQNCSLFESQAEIVIVKRTELKGGNRAKKRVRVELALTTFSYFPAF